MNRKQIQQLVEKNKGLDWWKPDLFEQNTKHLIPSNMDIMLAPPKEEKNYNCFLYALGLHQSLEILEDCKGFIYSNFLQHLLQNSILHFTDSPTAGDYILYQDTKGPNNIIHHVGVIKGNKVISKWSWGPLLLHNTWDVPESYGNDISYVQKISANEAEKLYWKFKKYNTK